MTHFFDLFAKSAQLEEAWNDPLWADRLFPLIASKSPFRFWKPGDPISQSAERWLIGVATWSGYDMRLLDVLAEALRRNSASLPSVDIFNTADCRSQAEFKRYIPKLTNVFQTPVVGVWQAGRLDWKGQGYDAREQAARRFGSGSAEVVRYVQDWMNDQRVSR